MHKQEDTGPEHYRVHVPWVDGKGANINKDQRLTRVSDSVNYNNYGTPSRGMRKAMTFQQSPNGSRMSETRIKPMTKAEVPKFGQTPKA